MIPKEFDYVAPGTLQEALSALRDGGEDAKVLAGGHSLIPAMKLRLASPTLLVDIRKIGDLHGFRRDDGHVTIGAMVSHYELQTLDPSEGFPLLAETAASIGDAQVRARGTIGGSLAHADPAADMPAAILALDGSLMASKLNGGGPTQREIPARDYFLDLFTTALEPQEIITGIRVPVITGKAGSAYVKIRNKASHYALAGAAVVLQVGDDGVCSNASVAITGAASTAFRLENVENALRGTRLEDNDLRNASGMAGDADVGWMSDLFGSEEYRKHLAGVVTSRALELARSRIG